MGINNDGQHSQLAACGAIPLVAARIAELVSDAQQSRSRKTWLDREFVIEGLKRNFERAMQAVPVLDSTGKPTGNFRYNGQVANRSLELLGKELGMFIDRHIQVQDPMSWDTKRWRQAMEKYAAKIGVPPEVLKAQAERQGDGDTNEKSN